MLEKTSETNAELLDDETGETLDPTEHHSDEPVVLRIPSNDAVACESGRTTLPDGTPCAFWRLPDITVNSDSLEIIYEGRVYALPKAEQTVLLLKGIVEAKGDIITANEISERFPIFDPDHAYRAIEKVPDGVKHLIESNPGKGYRLRRLT